MALKVLTLDTLQDLDMGRAPEAFQIELTRAVKDCLDRPNDERKRVISIELNLVPVKEVHGNTISCEGAKGTFIIKCKIPNRETQVCDFGVKQNGQLFFNEDNPRDHKQTTLLEEEGS